MLAIWGHIRTLDSHVGRLRAKLAPATNPAAIDVCDVGLQLVAAATPV